MFRPRVRIRLRQQLVILAFVSILPAMAITLHEAFDERRRIHERIHDEAGRLARAGLARQQLFIDNVQSRLAGLAAAQEIRDPASTGCTRFLRAYAERWQGSYRLGLFDPDGRLRCHDGADDAPVPSMPESAPRFARRVATAGRFTLGRYLPNPRTGRAVLVAGQPVTDAAGRVTGVLSVSREIEWLERFRLEAAMPGRSAVLLVSPQGELLTRAPALAPGSALPFDLPALLDSLRRSPTGVVETVGRDGERRVHAIARLPGPPGTLGPSLVIGLSHSLAHAEANAALRDNLARLLVMTLLVLGVAAVVGELLVLRRVRALLDATERLAAGDLDQPFTTLPRDGELGRIVEGLEHMRGALRTREREAAEAIAALVRSQERYRALVHGTSQIVWTADPLGRIVEDQPSWRAVTGQTWEEMRGQGWLDAIHPDDRERASAVWRTALRERSAYDTEYRVRTADGEYRPYATHGQPLLEADGSRVREWVGFCVDLTDRRAAEEALRAAEEASREGQKLEAIGRLAGGVAHDFNNLLTAVTSYAQLLLEDRALADGHRADVQEIRRAADRATTLVRQLLAFGRRQPVRPAVLALDEIVVEMEEMLRRLLGAGYTLDVRLDDAAGRILADRAQLEQVVLNLVLNARDAMPDGGVIGIATGATAGGGWAWLRVRDHGTGMDEDTQSRIFEPFFTTKGPGKGTGLGLATVYGTVRQAGGRVEVESAPGEGTCFTVHLPHAADDAPEAEEDDVARHGADAVPGAVAPPLAVALRARPARVLVVDDEAAVRNAAARVLRRHGYTVAEAADGVAALALAGPAADAVDLVLSDVVMPRMNGVELGERLRAIRPSLPLVLMSGYAPELSRRAERALPGVPLVAKPFDVAHLAAIVGDLLAAADDPVRTA